jgi:methionyl aminopeptidase
VTPKREVPDEIEKPDYHITGQPLSEIKVQHSSYIPVYSADDIEGIRLACKIGRDALDAAHAAAKVGVTTDEIDRVVHELIIAAGAYPSPLNYYGFPKSYCSSVNEIICHGIPDMRPLQDGDILNCDISVYKNGYHGDLNETFLIGNCAKSSKDLVTAAYDALMKSIDICKPDVMYRQCGKVISEHVEPLGFSVVRTYCGHGIGKLFHCNPNVPHYKGNKTNGFMKPGHIFTIEPMINAGKWKDGLWNDNWAACTIDGQRSAQFEHTILITEDGHELLTARTDTSPQLEIHAS